MTRTKTWVKCGALLVVLAACTCDVLNETRDAAAIAQSDDPVGTWKLRCVSPDGKNRECLVTLFRNGAAMNGEYTTDGVTRRAKNVTFDEGVVSIEVDGRFGGQPYGLTYKGTPRCEAMEGSVRWSFGWASGSFPFRGERVEQQVASSR
jgi:hypothetical protein